MKNYHWYISISVLLFIAILVAGCGSGGSSDGPTHIDPAAPAPVYTLGSPSQFTTYNINLTGVVAGDLNQDGLIDAAGIGELNSNAHLLLYYQGTNQRFSLIVDMPFSGFVFRGIAVGDINNDGLNDIVISAVSKTDSGAVLMVLYQDPLTNTLQDALQVPLSSTDIGDLCISDINGDGRKEIAVLSTSAADAVGRISIFYQLYDGSLGEEFVYTITPVTVTGNIRAADMNGDGRNDIVVQSGPGKFSIIQQKADGTLSLTPEVYAVVDQSSSSFAFAAGDINGDGQNDIVVAVPGTPGSLYLYAQNAGKLDASVEVALLQKSLDNVEIADIDGDGLNDIVGVVSGPVSSQSASGELRVYYQGPQHTFIASNFSSFGFSGASLLNPVESPPCLALADVTGDGLQDVLVGWSSAGLYVFPGTVQNVSGKAYSISGTVTANGIPLSSVSMTLSGNVSKTVTTDSSGNYSFTNLERGSYIIIPSKSGYVFSPANRSVIVNVSNVTAQDFTSTTYSISGTVTANGIPLSGVSVALTGPVSKTATTDSSGYYSFNNLGTGIYTITPSKTAYVFSPANRSVTLKGANVTAQDFTATTYSISGTITANGAPLSGVSVVLAGTASKTVTTDSNGYYSFNNLGRGSYVIIPSKSSYVFSPANRSVIINGADATGQDFTAATYSISGTVTVSGAPLAGVSMALTGPVTKTVTTDSSGNYSFTSVGSGNYTITPSKTAYVFSPANRSVSINGANVTGQNFTATTYSISGTVTMNGAPLSGVYMALTGPISRTVTTDSNGNYSFTTVGNGNYTITPSKIGYVFSPANRSVSVSNANIASQDFTGATFSVAGTITTSVGNPLSGVTVTLNGPVSKSVVTNSSGVYLFPIVGNGKYTITPSKVAYVFSPSNRSVTVNGTDVTGQDFTATTYSISGTVTVNGVSLSGVSMALAGPISKTVTTDSSGNYSFNTVGNGKYTVTPSKTGYVFSPANRSVSVNGANISGQDFTGTTFSISGTITTSGGNPLSGVTVTLNGPASKSVLTNSSGVYHFSIVGNGNYTIIPTKTGYLFDPTLISVTVNSADVSGQDFTGN